MYSKTEEVHSYLFCNSNNRVFLVQKKDEITSDDLLCTSTDDLELLLLVLNLSIKAKFIDRISAPETKHLLAYILCKSEDDEGNLIRCFSNNPFVGD